MSSVNTCAAHSTTPLFAAVAVSPCHLFEAEYRFLVLFQGTCAIQFDAPCTEAPVYGGTCR